MVVATCRPQRIGMMRSSTIIACFLKRWDIELVLGDAAYGSEKIRQTAEQAGIPFLSPINRRNTRERKDTFGQVLPVFLKTRFGLFGLCCGIERVFNELKSDGVEKPRMVGISSIYTTCVMLHPYA